ncbi:retrovirus-related pol polyprotein from transposon TNT 1-94 [Tanacetum coccineum]|uniref:Retrovirus-related pol polyprotein from transposon TNT 1-94 n=1 Tax=Tanacetum coccineum TaxID=301880 RepID=A0ABQ5BE80_9ASTR
MTIYNALPRKEYERVLICKTTKEVWHTLIITHQSNSQVKNYKIYLFTPEYEKFSISNEETIISGFTRFNDNVTSLKSLDPDYSSKNHVRKFLHALPLKWRANVTAIEEAKHLATLPLDKLIGNLKVYEMVLDNDGIAFKTTKEKVNSLALKAKVTREQSSDDNDSQGESNKDIDEEEAEAFNLLARNFRKGNRFGRKNRFGNNSNWFGKGRSNSFKDKGGESSKKKGACYNCGIEGHFASECRKLKENKDFMGEAWSDSEDGDEHQNDATCLMAIDSQVVVSKPSNSNIDLNIIDLEKENEELLKFNKDFTKTFEKLVKEKRALEDKNSKLSSKINDLEIEVKKLVNKEVVEPCQKCVELTQEVGSLKTMFLNFKMKH